MSADRPRCCSGSACSARSSFVAALLGVFAAGVGARGSDAARPTSGRSPARRRCAAPAAAVRAGGGDRRRPNPRHLERAAYLAAAGRGAAIARAQRRARRGGRVPERVRGGATRSPRRSATGSRAAGRTIDLRRGAAPTRRRAACPRRAATWGGEYPGPLARPPGRRDAARRRPRLRPHGRRRGRRRGRSDRQRGFRTNAEQAVLFAAHPTRSGSRRRATRCTGWVPSSTSARRPRTAGSPRTPDASGSSSGTRGRP